MAKRGLKNRMQTLIEEPIAPHILKGYLHS